MSDWHRHIALVGNPNVGKSSLFNQLTGLTQKIGNFPGVTVEKKEGSFVFQNHKISVTDLPGTYSLYPKSPDEQVVADFLSYNSTEKPDLILCVLDAANLKRNLLLFTQLSDLGYPMVIALNMQDVAEKAGIAIQVGLLQSRLKCPVIPINARNGEGLNEIKAAVTLMEPEARPSFFIAEEFNPSLASELRSRFAVQNEYAALLLAHQYLNSYSLNEKDRQEIAQVLNKYQFQGKSLQAAETIRRYSLIHELLMGVVSVTPPQRPGWSVQLDKVLTHRIFGYLSFLVILLVMFQAIFSWATLPMDLIDSGFTYANSWLKSVLPDNDLTSLLTDGIISGLGGIIIFIPQIALLFAFITILEESGYMARVMFIMDKIMRRFGLNGRSVVPLVSGVACAVPALMSTRVIDNKRDRLITIMVTPLMSCSARLPVFAVLIGLIVPQGRLWGVLSYQGLALMATYVIGILSAIGAAYIFSKFIKQKQKSFFIMELPIYQVPRWKNVLQAMYSRSLVFVTEAGKVILAISILLWALASYGPSEGMKLAETKVSQQVEKGELTAEAADGALQSAKLEASYAGILGKSIEPAIKPLGYDWKIGIALITSFAAREVFVGTISTIYNIGSDSDNTDTVKEKLRKEINPETGRPMYTPAVGASLIVFYIFAMQCMSTIATTFRETKSWKWTAIQFGYMTAMAYFGAFLVFRLLGGI